MRASDDLLFIRCEFERFEKKLNDSSQQGIVKHGLSKVAHVLADVAHIREEMLKLHRTLNDL